jgi:probable phosphoglycerate mutase
MTTLYLVRHGETYDNANHVMQGQTPGELTENGIAQAESVSHQMANKEIDVFVSSDLHRSVQTCEIIAAPHHAQVEQIPLLRERDWGSFTGKYIPNLQNVKPEEWPEDIESIPRLKSRATNFLTYIKTTYPDKVVLAVGHGIINKAIQSVYYKKPMNEIKPMTNAEVRILIL